MSLGLWVPYVYACYLLNVGMGTDIETSFLSIRASRVEAVSSPSESTLGWYRDKATEGFAALMPERVRARGASE